MEIKIPEKMLPHLEEYVAEKRAEALAAIPPNTEDRGKIETEIGKLGVETLILEGLKATLIQWKGNKAAKALREQLNAERDALAQDLA